MGSSFERKQVHVAAAISNIALIWITDSLMKSLARLPPRTFLEQPRLCSGAYIIIIPKQLITFYLTPSFKVINQLIHDKLYNHQSPTIF